MQEFTCSARAQHLASEGAVDARRLCIDGGSAGGYTTLACLAFRCAASRTRACHMTNLVTITEPAIGSAGHGFGRRSCCARCGCHIRVPDMSIQGQRGACLVVTQPPCSAGCTGCLMRSELVTLCLRRDVFSAGASHYGVADCELLAQVESFQQLA